MAREGKADVYLVVCIATLVFMLAGLAAAALQLVEYSEDPNTQQLMPAKPTIKPVVSGGTAPDKAGGEVTRPSAGGAGGELEAPVVVPSVPAPKPPDAGAKKPEPPPAP